MKLTIAAVACAGSGVVCGIPVQHMRDDTMTELDLRNKGLCGPVAMLISYLIPAMGRLTSIDVRQNNIAGDGAVQLAAAVLGNLKIEIFNKIPIKEMRANSLTELDLNWKYFGVEGGMVVAGLIPVMGGLTSLSLAKNELDDDGAEAISIGLKENKSLTKLDLSGKGYGDGLIGPRGAAALASAIAVNGALTSVEFRGNKLGDEGWGAIFAAICGNKDSKIMSMYVSGENIGPAGVNLIAEALRTNVTGAIDQKCICNSFCPLRGEDVCFLFVVPVASDKIRREVERRQPAVDAKHPGHMLGTC